MRIIMTGGGTGGHIYPAIAIADKIKSRYPAAEILFIGTERGMEKELVPAAGYPIKFITVSGFDRKNPIRNIKTLIDLRKGIKESSKIIKDFKPEVVIGTGGYVSAPVVRQAHKKKIKTYIHEQNAYPGVTNKMLGKYADKIFVSFEAAKKYFANPDKIIVTGNPIRQSFITAEREECREVIGITNEFVVLCFGGSLGADKINNTMIEVIDKLRNEDGLKFFFITGKRHHENITDMAQKRGIQLDDKIKILPYIDKIHVYLKGSDLVISRSGALTVSEITACGRASIMIPSPNVTGNHQYYNARVVADKGGAILIEEKDLTYELLYQSIIRLMEEPSELQYMESKSAALGILDSADIICDNIDFG